MTGLGSAFCESALAVYKILRPQSGRFPQPCDAVQHCVAHCVFSLFSSTEQRGEWIRKAGVRNSVDKMIEMEERTMGAILQSPMFCSPEFWVERVGGKKGERERETQKAELPQGTLQPEPPPPFLPFCNLPLLSLSVSPACTSSLPYTIWEREGWISPFN